MEFRRYSSANSKRKLTHTFNWDSDVLRAYAQSFHSPLSFCAVLSVLIRINCVDSILKTFCFCIAPLTTDSLLRIHRLPICRPGGFVAKLSIYWCLPRGWWFLFLVPFHIQNSSFKFNLFFVVFFFFCLFWEARRNFPHGILAAVFSLDFISIYLLSIYSFTYF